jgi:hypothetical protein
MPIGQSVSTLQPRVTVILQVPAGHSASLRQALPKTLQDPAVPSAKPAAKFGGVETGTRPRSSAKGPLSHIKVFVYGPSPQLIIIKITIRVTIPEERNNNDNDLIRPFFFINPPFLY